MSNWNFVSINFFCPVKYFVLFRDILLILLQSYFEYILLDSRFRINLFYGIVWVENIYRIFYYINPMFKGLTKNPEN